MHLVESHGSAHRMRMKGNSVETNTLPSGKDRPKKDDSVSPSEESSSTDLESHMAVNGTQIDRQRLERSKYFSRFQIYDIQK